MTLDDLYTRFLYHAPDEQDALDHTAVRGMLLEVAERLCNLCPEGRELSLTITKLEEVMFWANAAISRKP
jgi:hypothetical protein